jgi:hypothetical protein
MKKFKFTTIEKRFKERKPMWIVASSDRDALVNPEATIAKWGFSTKEAAIAHADAITRKDGIITQRKDGWPGGPFYYILRRDGVWLPSHRRKKIEPWGDSVVRIT